MRMHIGWFALLLALGTGCERLRALSQDDGPSPIRPKVEAPKGLALTLEEVARAESPVAMATRPGDDALYVAEKGGRVRRLVAGAWDADAVLDVRTEVSHGAEQGLLGLAFAKDGGELYVNYTDKAGDTRVVAFPMEGVRAQAEGQRELLHVKQPYANHNGGNLVLGPDGMLWIGLGDGGSAGDPKGNGQNLSTLLGKMLRIDPRPAGGAPYAVPPDNPFVGQPGARPEIWAYGLRNPWRYAFDRATGDLWMADVGQNTWEEVDFVAAGARGGMNFGWAAREGAHDFKGEVPSGTVDPIYEYRHADGACSITGGYVYRGKAIANLVGTYLFSDFCTGKILGLRRDTKGALHVADLNLATAAPASFGEDAAGEVYVLSLSGSILRVRTKTAH